MWRWNFIVVVIVLAGILVIFQIMSGLKSVSDYEEPFSETATISSAEVANYDWDNYLLETATLPLRIGETDFLASVAVTPEEREQGLSNTSELPAGVVKLFVFDFSDEWGIWMKDMNYPIDIIWLNEEKRVVHVEHQIPPESYPMVFRSLLPALYVIEVSAGLATTMGLVLDDKIEFDWRN